MGKVIETKADNLYGNRCRNNGSRDENLNFFYLSDVNESDWLPLLSIILGCRIIISFIFWNVAHAHSWMSMRTMLKLVSVLYIQNKWRKLDWFKGNFG